MFLVQGFWLIGHQTLTDSDYQYARCGRETWEKPSPLAGYYTSCGNIHDGILGLPAGRPAADAEPAAWSAGSTCFASPRIAWCRTKAAN